MPHTGRGIPGGIRPQSRTTKIPAPGEFSRYPLVISTSFSMFRRAFTQGYFRVIPLSVISETLPRYLPSPPSCYSYVISVPPSRTTGSPPHSPRLPLPGGIPFPLSFRYLSTISHNSHGVFSAISQLSVGSQSPPLPFPRAVVWGRSSVIRRL